MIEPSKSHRPSFRLSILFAMLGTCVFLWGLGYKLSLYDVHQHSIHQIPVAKLISRDEDTGATERASLRAPALDPSPTGLLFGFMMVSAWIISDETTRAKNAKRDSFTPVSWSSLRSADLNAFFFRPPPTV